MFIGCVMNITIGLSSHNYHNVWSGKIYSHLERERLQPHLASNPRHRSRDNICHHKWTKQWYHGPNTNCPTFLTGITDCINLQYWLGWSNFIEGVIHSGWHDYQQKYYESIWSSKSGAKWMKRLLLCKTDFAKSLWDHRNNTKHQQKSHNSAAPHSYTTPYMEPY